MCDSEQLRVELKNFLQFASEKKSLNGDLIINSAIDLLQRVPPARSAVLMFFGQLFDDLVDKYLVENNRISSSKSESDYLWWTLLHPSETSKPVTKERKSCDSQCAVGDTPMSPPVMETGNATIPPLPDSSDPNDDGQAINRYVDLIGKTLVNLVESDESNCRQMVIDWCLQFISGLSAKCPLQSLTSTPAAASPVAVFSEYIRFWIKCHVVDLILKIIMNLSSLPSNSSLSGDSNSSSDQKFTAPVMNCQTLLQRLIEFSPASDWISAHLIASIPSESDSFLFAACIECLLESKANPSSVTNMLSYISEHNPQAIINASPFNIPFLLKLAANSRPLLNLLAIEALRQVDIPKLNDLSQTLTENLQPPVIYCILNANNSYELLQLVFKACSHRDANAIVREKAFSILNSIVSHLHELIYTTNADTSAPILEVLRTNSDHLVSSALNRSSGNLKKLQTRVIELLCLHFGLDFSSRVFHQILNTLNSNSDNISSAVVSPPSPILVNLIKYLKLSYGAHVYECFRKAVVQPTPKEPKFWANLLSLFDSDDALELDIDQLTSMFTEYTQSDILDQRIFYTLKLILCCVERDPRLVKRPKHHLCISLMSFYMKLLDIIATDDYDLDLNMQLATVCQKLMSYLSKNLEANQHILTRTLIEAELQRNDRPRSTSFERLPAHLNLFKENLEYGEISKFRKISLNPRKKVFNQAIDSHESSLRRQLLLDAVRCCVTESQAFASLLVECVTPDVMFNDKPWPDEDFLKVTIERDLHIARKFDSNPVLWDFCELIANTGNLYSCSVLIRALMAVQLCCWASATASKEKLSSTQKLVSLIASSELAPSCPFKYLPQIMESLNPWEIFCVLNDLWRYMRDNSPPSVRPNQSSLRTYLERLRIITSQKLPGPTFVKIFKGLQVSPEDEQGRSFPAEEWV